MGPWKTCGAALVLFLLPSCVGLTPTLPSTARPGAAGYVAALLSRGSGDGFALRVVETKTGLDYIMEFEYGETARAQMIEVPPGTYRVASWTAFTDTRGRLREEEVPAGHVLARPFTIGAGQVVLLGSLHGTTTVWQEPPSGGTTKFTKYWEVVPKRITLAIGVADLRKAYPAFAGAPVTCVLCAAEGEPEPAPRPEPKRKELQLTPPTLELKPPTKGLRG